MTKPLLARSRRALLDVNSIEINKTSVMCINVY